MKSKPSFGKQPLKYSPIDQEKKSLSWKIYNNSARSEVRPDNSEFISIASGDQTCIMGF